MMNKPTKEEVSEALEGSVRKWEGIVEGTVEDLGSFNCPLCHIFPYNEGSDVCGGCPVKATTGQGECQGTPYDDYIRENSVENAQREVDFLISLRSPSDEQA